MVPEQLGEWVLTELPRLNQAILRENAPPALLLDELREHVLSGLPDVAQLTPVQAQQLVVLTGFVGASVARHYQEHTPGGKEHPEFAFGPLTVGGAQIPFRAYFAALAVHTGTGHYTRDSYASLVRWNVGTVRVGLGGETVAEIPGVFDDGRIRSYTGSGGEESFFLLVKQGEAVELAVNELLGPLTRDRASLICADARHRVRTATALLARLRQLFLDFAALPPDQAMPPEHFMDVFRQFAAHWTVDDIPPSGALDPEALKRDFLLGLAVDHYDHLARRLFPAMLDHERAVLSELMDGPTLPQRLLDEIGSSEQELRLSDDGDLRRLVAHHPALLDWYRLLAMHARVSGAHLMLSKKFLFKPQRMRDEAGLGDREIVSNRAGTTGMTETFLDRLTRARQNHSLAALRLVLPSEAPKQTTKEEEEPTQTGDNADGDPAAEVRSGRGAATPVVVELTG
ncbi:hypothetical protein [Actinoplanes sp. GCM10030250]|uniref:hypothetical protein n=1 Tax=Actinoplanes sp. GCM10030250 TaxID=3273376 RepID=UPI003610E0D7